MTQRVLVLGLDGATFDLIGPWIDSGELPTLRALRDGGASGVLESVFPPLTPCAWPSFYTGKNPGKHGLVGYKCRRKGSYDEMPLTAAERRARTLFELIGDHGRHVAVLSVPMTYPASPVNGVLVTCLFTPRVEDLYTTECAYPPSFKEEMRAVLGPFRIHPRHGYSKGRIGDLVLDYRETLDQRIRLLLHVMGSRPWDFAITVLNETDHIQHQIWHVIDPSHHRHDPAEARAFGGVMKEFWREIDRRLGEAVLAAGPETTVIVMSDHGHGPVRHWIHLNNFLARRGYLRFRSNPLTLAKRLLFRIGATPRNAFRLVERLRRGRKGGGADDGGGTSRLMRRLFLSENDVDWKRTEAYAVGHMGQINVNLAGREPEGRVRKPDVPALRARLEKDLADIRLPGSGAPAIKRLVPREELFSGAMVSRASDFFIETTHPEHQALGGASFISNRVVEPAFGNSATHRMNGIFLAKGPWIRPGSTLESGRIVDLAPMILHILGLPIPDDMDGRVHPEILAAGILEANPPAFVPAADLPEAAEHALTEKEIAVMKENLRKLGYVD